MLNDELHVVHARAAGLDVHKMETTATVRLCVNAGEPVCETRRFDALAGGLAGLSAWLCAHRVEAATMEATGVYWETPWDALTEAGIEVQLLHAQQVKQLRGRKTDIEDSRWLARVCQLGLGRVNTNEHGHAILFGWNSPKLNTNASRHACRSSAAMSAFRTGRYSTPSCMSPNMAANGEGCRRDLAIGTPSIRG